MEPCTDEDLARLIQADCSNELCQFERKMPSLLARLEAAELVAKMMPWFIDVNPTFGGSNLHVYDAAHAYQQWLAFKTKDGTRG